LVSDGVLVGDGVLVSDGVVTSDFTVQAQSAVLGGDTTSCMNVLADTGIDFLGY
jgi:hypothetical protein